MARSLGQIEIQLTDFMSKHGAVLSDDERAALVDASSDAGYGKFDVVGGDVDPEANKKADEMYSKLKTLEARLFSQVRSQASL